MLKLDHYIGRCKQNIQKSAHRFTLSIDHHQRYEMILSKIYNRVAYKIMCIDECRVLRRIVTRAESL